MSCCCCSCPEAERIKEGGGGEERGEEGKGEKGREREGGGAERREGEGKGIRYSYRKLLVLLSFHPLHNSKTKAVCSLLKYFASGIAKSTARDKKDLKKC